MRKTAQRREAVTRKPSRKKTPADVRREARAKATAALVAEEERIQRALTAYKLRLKGKTNLQIAETLQITEAEVRSSVSSRLLEAAEYVNEGTKQQMLALELDRLDALMNMAWDAAEGGDMQAILRILQVIRLRANLLGLENITTASITHQTVVISGTSQEYIAALAEIAGKDPKELENILDAVIVREDPPHGRD